MAQLTSQKHLKADTVFIQECEGNGHCRPVNCNSCPRSLGNDLMCDNDIPAILLKLIPDAINQFPEYFL